MCIDDNLALHAKSKDGYIKHLESLLLDSEFYRCEHCKRVDAFEAMTEVSGLEDNYVCDDRNIFVCDTCLPAWERAEKKAQEIAESDERDYRQAKGGI